MCWKIGNDQCHCLTFLSVLGLLQLLVGIPITVLSFLVFFQTDLGYLLSPFWCGISLILASILGMLIRPTRLTSIMCVHVIVTSLCVSFCVIAGTASGLYGTAVHLENFTNLVNSTDAGSGAMTIDCIFTADANLYSEGFRDTLEVIDQFVPSCDDLDNFWEYLIGNMSLCFLGLLVSMVALFTNCLTPCIEERYGYMFWSPEDKDSDV